MAVLTVNAVVTRLEGAISGLSGWSVSPLPVSLVARSTRQTAHQHAHAFASRTDVRQGGVTGRRASTTEGAYVDTTVSVEWSFSIRPDGYAADILSAHTAEQALLVALMGVSLVDLHVTPVSLDRQVLDTRSHLLGTIRLRCTHSLALT